MKEPREHEPDIDPDAPPSESELEEAALLRDALGEARAPNEHAELARALVLAHAPRPLDAAQNEALVARALQRGVSPERRGSVRHLGARGRLIATGTSLCALAAAVFFFVTNHSAGLAPVASNDLQLLHARSSQPLFHEPFAVRGGTSARVDRILSARAGDFRENMFASWDVR
jgi:hypothetical protein